MKVLRYLWQGKKLLLYIAFGIAISLAMELVLWDWRDVFLFLKLFSLSVLLFVLLRCADDYFDYEKDNGRKEQPISKRGILCVALVIAVVFVSLNVLFYSLSGLCSILALGYIVVQQKAWFLKLLFLPIVSAYYFYMNCSGNLPFAVIGIYLAACLILSAAFYLFKRRREE